MYAQFYTISRHLAFVTTVTAIFFLVLGARADSMHSACGFSSSAEQLPEETAPCIFSQRQGFINVSMDDGRSFEFSPAGDQPGNFRDTEGNAVYRLRGLGTEGQLFKLPDAYLYVFWHLSRLACASAELTAPRHCELSEGGVHFSVQASAGSSINLLRIRTVGLSHDNAELSAELDGSAYRAELADLDSNGWPEVYVYVSSAGSGSYGSLVAYAVNNGKSASPIYLPPLEDSPEALPGYMGHDEFAVVENRLVRRFPIYRDDDTNAAASGGTRQIQYRLQPGEAGWRLEVDRIEEY